ncbi:MAG: 4Fe-4S binding protein [Planctomycetota bacterium]
MPAKKRGAAPDPDACGTVSLPVLTAGRGRTAPIRKSRSGKRRAIVLASVQVLMIAHVALWLLSRKYGWWGGRTTTPIEPSEAMEFAKHGVVNAGLVFFALALVATLILGRWFCGWGCHLVLLQDLCGWMMKKLGVRPKPFRSRLLVYVPLGLALYMFIWPLFYRLAIAPWTRSELAWPGFSLHLTTADFYRTFPGVLVSIPFLLVCGFAAVYFLGSKGFCTYGCPYGGFFAPLDEFAAGRIRVTDACRHCGHCTTACTSNVRVHEEVREYGMVVDPGCMKTLDCVSVCPNDALYFGFGRPAQLKGRARRREPKRRYDLTWGEEIGLAVVFGLSFLSVRGVYNVVPMLMAAGVAGIVTFMSWKLWRLLREPNVRFHQFQLRYRGRVRAAGWVFAAVAGLVLVTSAHSGLVNGAEAAGAHFDRKVTVGLEQVLRAGPTPLPPEQERFVDRAIRCYRGASSLADGGFGLGPNAEIDVRLAWMYCCKRDFAEAERCLRRAIDRAGESEVLARDLARVLRAQAKDRQALGYYEQVLADHPDYAHLFNEMMLWCGQRGFIDEAVRICRRRLRERPDDEQAARWLDYVSQERD